MRPRCERPPSCCGSSKCPRAPNSPSSSATRTGSQRRRTPPWRQQALAVDRHGASGGPGPSFALPITERLRLLPGSRESGTTAITFLYYPPDHAGGRPDGLGAPLRRPARARDRAAGGPDRCDPGPVRPGASDRPRPEPDRADHARADRPRHRGQLPLAGRAARPAGRDRGRVPDHARGTPPDQHEVRHLRARRSSTRS